MSFAKQKGALNGITAFNTGKKRDETLAVIQKFIPKAEDSKPGVMEQMQISI